MNEARFWLGVFKINPPVLVAGIASDPLMAEGVSELAIEVMEQGGDMAVLFSSVQRSSPPDTPGEFTLNCRIGFANASKPCSAWRDRGFPLVDAVLVLDKSKSTLEVHSAHFGQGPSMLYDSPLVTIEGVRLSAQTDQNVALIGLYDQYQEAPDAGMPASLIARRKVQWNPGRKSVTSYGASTIRLDVADSRCPSLRPLKTGTQKLRSMWIGELELPTEPLTPKTPLLMGPRVDLFGVPEFRFEDVEVLGFRIELGPGKEVTDSLAALIAPLNFHLNQDPETPVPDFRYQLATRTILLEILRYGSMKLASQKSPLTMRDYQSQHELVIRVQVGRVDDDTSQARDPATFVPAIFVDNPWSKVLGRDIQGFAKCMASFCVAEGSKLIPLCPDGTLRAGKKPQSLANISSICVTRRMTKEGEEASGSPILHLDCKPDRYGNWDDFQRVDAGLVLGGLSRSDTRWRQIDFEQPEFRRTFARNSIADSMTRFRSVQVSPVGKRILAKTWITSVFTIDDNVQVVNPAGGVSLSVVDVESAPTGWRSFCRLLGVKPGAGMPLAFQTGNWYRLKFSMSMKVDDGLEWSD